MKLKLSFYPPHMKQKTGGFFVVVFYVPYSTWLHLPAPQNKLCRRMLGSDPNMKML